MVGRERRRESNCDGERNKVSTISEPAIDLGIVREGGRVIDRSSDIHATEKVRNSVSQS